uniref:Uncharacterized protein n=1 Tax=Trypanosoma congolense (strain IL3000) TaxID=1068625 RepID=G0UQT9_TRYCI|nr:hypothetical protein, unlikely [Trypanosoma congolense IL3000]
MYRLCPHVTASIQFGLTILFFFYFLTCGSLATLSPHIVSCSQASSFLSSRTSPLLSIREIRSTLCMRIRCEQQPKVFLSFSTRVLSPYLVLHGTPRNFFSKKKKKKQKEIA